MKTTYKDLSPKEALVLRFFEIATRRAYEILGGQNDRPCSKKGALHVAWLYKKYLVALPEYYPYLEDCYLLAENGEAYTVPEIQDYFLNALMKCNMSKAIIGSIADGGVAYQAINYTLGAMEWSADITRLFKAETWHWKNDLTLTHISDSDAEGREQLYIYLEFLNKPEQKPVIIRRVGPFTKYVYRYSAAFDAETFEPVDISDISVARMRTRPANEYECDRLY